MNTLLINYEYPPLGGGAGNATKEIAKALSISGAKVTVVTACYEDLSAHDDSDGFIVYRLDVIRKQKDRSNVFEMLHFVIKAIFFTDRLVKKDRPNKVIAFFALPTGLVAYYLFKKHRIPYILSLRGGDVPGFLHSELKWHHRLTIPLTHTVWKNASHIVANSMGLQALAEKTALPLGKDVLYIPNGVDAEKYSPLQESNEHALEKKEVRLLFVGRLVPQKRVHMILEAVSAVSDKNNFFITIVGDGPLRNELESLSETLGLTKRVLFKGWVDRDELVEEYKKHDVLLLLSSEEGMPNVVLEAMASGLAIIASNITGADELVIDGKNGFLVETSAEVTNALMLLSSGRILLEEFKRESEMQARMFSWENVAKAYCNL